MQSKIEMLQETGVNRSVGGLCFAFVCLCSLQAVAGCRSGRPSAISNPRDVPPQIRVNQVGYEAGPRGRAYLMAAQPVETDATFSLTSKSGRKVYTAAIGPKLGQWGKYFVYALDFPAAQAGTFTLTTRGSLNVASLEFPINTPADLYVRPLQSALYFYQNQRDGKDFIRTPLRTAPSHLNDEKATVYYAPSFDGHRDIVGGLKPTGAVIDAEGGWWDAGDYVKFVRTASYTVALMFIGVRDFPDAMGKGSAFSSFDDEAKFGMDFLQKMWNDKTRTLYYQVAVISRFSNDRNLANDHSIWRLAQADDSYMAGNPDYRYIRHRPVFQYGPAGSKIGPKLAGALSADFAECYQIYRLSDRNRAGRCLLSAEHIFDLAQTAPGQLQTAVPHDDTDPRNPWQDDMELGATEIYIALHNSGTALPPGLPHRNAEYYLLAAAHWASAYIHSSHYGKDTFNVYDVSGLAHYELYRAISLAGRPSGLAVTKADLLGDLKKQIDGRAVAQAARDPFGFGIAWNGTDTAARGTGLVVMAKEYDYLTHSDTYAAYAHRWQANVLGANPWGVSFIVGDGTTFPHCMQHQVANLVGSLNGGPPLLRGALVEGPTERRRASSGWVTNMRNCPADGIDIYKQFNADGAVYRDNVQFYRTNEPALDLTAPSFLMFSWDIAGHPQPLGN